MSASTSHESSKRPLRRRTDGKLAEAVGNPAGVRAVARAVGENRLAIVLPCHRILGANGQLTGYGGGLWRKRYLLDLEQKRATFAAE